MNQQSASLDAAHEELEKHMAVEEKSRLAKSLSALRSHFGLAQDGEDLSKAKVNSTPMKGDEGYPNDQGAAKRIKAASDKSHPAKTDQYEGVPTAEDDTTDYENSEDDEMDGHGGKKVTDKAAKSMRAATEETFYEDLVKADPTGDIVGDINATDALELLASTFGKSMAHVSGQTEAVGSEVVELRKSLALVAGVLADVVEALDAGSLVKSAAPKDDKIAAEDTEAPKTGEESEEEVEKSMSPAQRTYKRTFDWLAQADKMNEPAFFSGLTGEGLNKSHSAEVNTADSLNTPAGRQRVKTAVTSLVKSGKLKPDFLSALDSKSPYEVVVAMPSDVRKDAGLA